MALENSGLFWPLHFQKIDNNKILKKKMQINPKSDWNLNGL